MTSKGNSSGKKNVTFLDKASSKLRIEITSRKVSLQKIVVLFLLIISVSIFRYLFISVEKDVLSHKFALEAPSRVSELDTVCSTRNMKNPIF